MSNIIWALHGVSVVALFLCTLSFLLEGSLGGNTKTAWMLRALAFVFAVLCFADGIWLVQRINVEFPSTVPAHVKTEASK